MTTPPYDCLDPEIVAAYADHQLSDDEREQVERHIDGCASCRELISAVVRSQWSSEELPAVTGGTITALGGVLPRGTRVGAFEIERPLDAGGMGLVYEARDTRLDRKVALKCVRESRGRSEQLLGEARAMARLAHPNVVAVHDVIEAHGQIFIAMELVVGKSVRHWLDAEPRSWKAIVDVFLAAGAGLAAAHAAGIVHGDIKPANLLLGDDGRARVADFGLSSSREPAESAAPDAPDEDRVVTPRGTPAYMPPAQRDGEPADAAGDQYSFCASLHEALFGALPSAAPPRNPRLPRRLRRLIARGLARDPSARFPSMTALLRELRATRSTGRRWAVAAAALTAAIAVVAFGFGGRRVQAQMCEAAAPRLASPWNEEARWLVRRSFESTKLSYAPQIYERVAERLERYTTSLENARQQACQPGWFRSSVPPERYSAQLKCLEERNGEALALVQMLGGDVDANLVQNAVGAIEQLPPIARCLDAPVAVAPRFSPSRMALADQFARVRALALAGRFKEVDPLAKALVEAAEATGEPAVRSAALVALGTNQVKLSQNGEAQKTLLTALRLSEIAGEDFVRARAWVSLVLNAYNQGHHEEALLLKDPALGAAERIGDVYLQTEILMVEGAALSQLGKLAEAEAVFAGMVEMRRKAYGERDYRYSSGLGALGNAYAMQGKLEAGIAVHTRAAMTAEAALGAAHPTVGIQWGNVATDHLYGLQLPAARANAEKACAILEAATGPKSRAFLLVLSTLAGSYLEAGDATSALEHFSRADALWQQVNAKHPSRGGVLFGLYQARRALGLPTTPAELEEILAMSKQSPPFDVGRIQLELAKVTSGPRTAELLAQAIRGLSTSTLPLVARDLAAAQQMERELGLPPTLVATKELAETPPAKKETLR